VPDAGHGRADPADVGLGVGGGVPAGHDEPAGAARGHLRQHGVRDRDGAEQEQVHPVAKAVDVKLGGGDERGAAGQGLVGDDVDAAVAVLDLLHDRGGVGRVRQVCGEGGGVGALGGQFARHGPEPVGVAGDERDAEALLAEAAGEGGAETGAGTEDGENLGHEGLPSWRGQAGAPAGGAVCGDGAGVPTCRLAAWGQKSMAAVVCLPASSSAMRLVRAVRMAL
jgi:hypothetical protein